MSGRLAIEVSRRRCASASAFWKSGRSKSARSTSSMRSSTRSAVTVTFMQPSFRHTYARGNRDRFVAAFIRAPHSPQQAIPDSKCLGAGPRGTLTLRRAGSLRRACSLSQVPYSMIGSQSAGPMSSPRCTRRPAMVGLRRSCRKVEGSQRVTTPSGLSCNVCRRGLRGVGTPRALSSRHMPRRVAPCRSAWAASASTVASGSSCVESLAEYGV